MYYRYLGVSPVLTYRFGKHPPKQDYRTRRFEDYATGSLPMPPLSYDLLGRVYENVKQRDHDPTVLFPMDGNDVLGDCTIAAMAHAVTVYRGLIGKRFIMPQHDVAKTYLHLTGGIDTGLNALDVLNYWRKHAVGGDRIYAFTKVDHRDHKHVQQAMQLFGGVYVGFQVQEHCVEDFVARQPWTGGVLTTEGHAVYAVGYDQTYVTMLTWGNTQRATWGWWDNCVDEVYAIIPPEARKRDFTPGFRFEQLEEDLLAVAA
jgi:hypothetical protein